MIKRASARKKWRKQNKLRANVREVYDEEILKGTMNKKLLRECMSACVSSEKIKLEREREREKQNFTTKWTRIATDGHY